MTIRLGIIGLGHWGPNHVRNFSSIPGVRVIAGADPDVERRKRVEHLYPNLELVEDGRDLTARKDLDAVIISTSTAMHYSLAKAALENGKHVLCEKPLTTKSREAWELVRLAESVRRVLMVGHVFLFNPGIAYIRKAVREGVAGRIYYVNAVRTNLGPFRYDVNAAWDLASHDIYILNSLLEERPDTVAAIGGCYLQREKQIEDIVFLTLQYPSGILGHIHVSWLDPRKVRQITVVGEQKMLLWDDLGSPGPVTIYDRKVQRELTYSTFGEFQLLAREGDVVYPRVPSQEPLAVEAKAFVKWVTEGKSPEDLASGMAGASVVDILEAASQSLSQAGKPVRVQYGG